jgi:hypothetical protein
MLQSSKVQGELFDLTQLSGPDNLVSDRLRQSHVWRRLPAVQGVAREVRYGRLLRMQADVTIPSLIRQPPGQ